MGRNRVPYSITVATHKDTRGHRIGTVDFNTQKRVGVVKGNEAVTEIWVRLNPEDLHPERYKKGTLST